MFKWCRMLLGENAMHHKINLISDTDNNTQIKKYILYRIKKE